ncbi:MAG: hypothetical protein RSA27_04975, partial [Oscillospiraceae bacterium]
MNKLLARILIFTMLVTATPLVSFAEEKTTEAPVANWIEEKFEGVPDAMTATINNKLDGWGWGEAKGADGKLDIWVGDCSLEGDSLRVASRDWYKNVWTTLDLAQNGIVKHVAAGMPQAEAEALAATTLVKDTSISFTTRFEMQGVEADPSVHEQYIRVKGGSEQVVAELSVRGTELFVVGLNAAKNANEAYKVKDVQITKDNTDWHNIKIDLSQTRNAFRVTINGEVFKGSPHGEWIPCGSETGLVPSEPQAIETLTSMEMGHFWSAWWGCLFMDNLVVTPVEEGFGGDPTPTDPPTP